MCYFSLLILRDRFLIDNPKHIKVKEVEQRFEDGMLTKLSKMTDLIAKLDGFANGEDKQRVQKS